MYAAERSELHGTAAGAAIAEPAEAATLLVVVWKICSEPAVAWACRDGKGYMYVEEAATKLDVKDGEVFGFLLGLLDVSSSLKVAAWGDLNDG